MSSNTVVPATIVGGGRVGQALSDMGGGLDTVVRRGESVETTDGPIYVCTRNDVLGDVVAGTPEGRRSDLVFLQNGMLQPWLEEQGLGDCTQALIYFAVAKLGEAPTDGITDVNPEGLTAVTGKWADAFAERLNSSGLSCHVLDSESFRGSMFEKLIWISAFMLVGARHGGCTVGEVESTYKSEVKTLIEELLVGTAAEAGVTFQEGAVGRLCAYARSVAHFPTAVKEFEWRNGWFHGVSTKALSVGNPDPFPTHSAWLKEVGAI